MKCLNVFLLFFIWFQSTIADCPWGIISRGTSKAEQNQIINLHNGLRRKLALGQVPGQPKGKNFATMVWDNQLALKAQAVANTCNFQHVTIKDGRWSWVGQNLYAYSSTSKNLKTDWAAAFNGWTYGELPGYSYGTRVYNHYTQAVWAKTKYVGCAMAFFLQSNRWYRKFYVCNYGPGGNIIGQYPYQSA